MAEDNKELSSSVLWDSSSAALPGIQVVLFSDGDNYTITSALHFVNQNKTYSMYIVLLLLANPALPQTEFWLLNLNPEANSH